MNSFIILLFAIILLSGCSVEKTTDIYIFGSPRHIKCYSSGKLIYEGQSTGKIANDGNNNWIYFKDKSTKKEIQILADCIIIVK